MKNLHDMPVWAPTNAELRAFEQRIRAERAKAFRGAARYVARKIGGVFSHTAERAADRVQMDGACTS